MHSTAMATGTANIQAATASGPQPARLGYAPRPTVHLAADRRAAEPIHGGAATVLRVLAACDIPFATFDLAGARTGVSDAAATLLERDADRAATWSRARALASTALSSTSRMGYRAGPAAVLAPNGRWALRAYALPPGDPTRAAVVLFLPPHTGAVTPLDAGPASAETERPAANHWRLTAREVEVARLIGCGESTKTIAAALGISVHTACRHTERIYAKIGVRTRSQAVLALSRSAPAAYGAAESDDG